jgi:glutathione S-transferase
VQLTLISHALCPYVQRAAIVLAEKGVAFGRRDVDLAAKPAWFKAISPLAKTPVLLAGDVPIFESAVICEYLDETWAPRLHSHDALVRARERAWMEFGSVVLNAIGAFYNAADAPSLRARRDDLVARFAQLEAVLPERGPWFAGERFSLVDAAFAPVLRYFEVFEQLGEESFFAATPRLRRWRLALSRRASVQQAVSADYPFLLERFLRERGSELSRRIARHKAQCTASPASVK